MAPHCSSSHRLSVSLMIAESSVAWHANACTNCQKGCVGLCKRQFAQDHVML